MMLVQSKRNRSRTINGRSKRRSHYSQWLGLQTNLKLHGCEGSGGFTVHEVALTTVLELNLGHHRTIRAYFQRRGSVDGQLNLSFTNVFCLQCFKQSIEHIVGKPE